MFLGGLLVYVLLLTGALLLVPVVLIFLGLDKFEDVCKQLSDKDFECTK